MDAERTAKPVSDAQPPITLQEGRRKGNIEKWHELSRFLFDRQKHVLVFGENAETWGFRLMYYSSIYFLLLIMLTVIMSAYLVTVDEIKPREVSLGSPLKENPGLAIRPQVDVQSPLIRFIQGRESTYQPYVLHIQTFLDQYENHNQDGENFIDCEDGKPPHLKDKVCRFDPFNLGPECQIQTTFGFEEGTPCILLKLNKLFGWEAETLPADEVPPLLGDRWRDGYIGLTCEGEYAADIENIGNVTFTPPEGFPAFFYPYLNQEGFRSPLAFVKFNNPANGVVINVVCKAWAKNIHHAFNDQQGLVRFSLLID